MPFTSRALTFLRQLKRNNRREWFEAHRDTYESAVREPLMDLVEELDVRLARLAPEIVGDRRRSLFRIHRDVRFSRDKSPYKTHASAWMYHRSAGRSVGKEATSGGAGFYFHLEPGASLVAGGLWMPMPASLRRIREAIAADPEGFARTMASRAFTRRFGTLSEEAMLQRLPRGYAPGHPAERWLRYRSFTVSRALSDADVLQPKLVDAIAKDYEVMVPLVRWLNRAVGYREQVSR
jgi:uncharacterized protein (TIGR02453 family)